MHQLVSSTTQGSSRSTDFLRPQFSNPLQWNIQRCTYAHTHAQTSTTHVWSHLHAHTKHTSCHTCRHKHTHTRTLATYAHKQIMLTWVKRSRCMLGMVHFIQVLPCQQAEVWQNKVNTHSSALCHQHSLHTCEARGEWEERERRKRGEERERKGEGRDREGRDGERENSISIAHFMSIIYSTSVQYHWKRTRKRVCCSLPLTTIVGLFSLANNQLPEKVPGETMY